MKLKMNGGRSVGAYAVSSRFCTRSIRCIKYISVCSITSGNTAQNAAAHSARHALTRMLRWYEQPGQRVTWRHAGAHGAGRFCGSRPTGKHSSATVAHATLSGTRKARQSMSLCGDTSRTGWTVASGSLQPITRSAMAITSAAGSVALEKQ